MKRRLWVPVIWGVAAMMAVTCSGCLTSPFRRPTPTQPQTGVEPTITLLLEDKGQKVTMRMEQYLEGVVAAEMGPDWPPEALGAQAMLARTFTVQRIDEKGGTRQLHGTDACTNPDHFQAYDASKVNDAVKAAVNATRGTIITSAGKPVLAWFHANSGGMTATPEEGLGFREQPTPYLTSQKDVAAKVDQWTQTFTTDEIMNALKKMGKQVAAVKSMRISKKGPSGRATEFTVDSQVVPGPELRTALGANKMRSTLLDSITMSSARVTMKGKGWGHGVGMSQEGARTMAQQGKKATDIINFYYKGVQIEKRWR